MRRQSSRHFPPGRSCAAPTSIGPGRLCGKVKLATGIALRCWKAAAAGCGRTGDTVRPTHPGLWQDQPHVTGCREISGQFGGDGTDLFISRSHQESRRTSAGFHADDEEFLLGMRQLHHAMPGNGPARGLVRVDQGGRGRQVPRRSHPEPAAISEGGSGQAGSQWPRRSGQPRSDRRARTGRACQCKRLSADPSRQECHRRSGWRSRPRHRPANRPDRGGVGVGPTARGVDHCSVRQPMPCALRVAPDHHEGGSTATLRPDPAAVLAHDGLDPGIQPQSGGAGGMGRQRLQLRGQQIGITSASGGCQPVVCRKAAAAASIL